MVTSRANAPSRVTATPVALPPVVVRNATSAAGLDTLLAAAPRAAATEVASAVASVVVNRPATRAVASATWLVTAPRARSATTVRKPPNSGPHLDPKLTYIVLGGELGHVSRDCPTEAKGERVCYKCKESGHVQAACPN